MTIEAVTVSVNYADHLAQCLTNRQQVDRWVIVTEATDTDTIELCKQHDLEYVLTDRLHENGAAFAKGKAINDGLATLAKQDWLLVLDSDVILPDTTREYLESVSLDQLALYGMKRRSVSTNLPIRNHIDIQGYFQLFHSSQVTVYPEVSTNASLDDSLFQQQWLRQQRIMLPLSCEHVGEHRLHWFGRPTGQAGTPLARSLEHMKAVSRIYAAKCKSKIHTTAARVLGVRHGKT